jgi:hypothetical protein
MSALHVSAYLDIIRCVEIRGNNCNFRATVIGVFMLARFLNEVNAVPPSMPHGVSLLIRLLLIECKVWFLHVIVQYFQNLHSVPWYLFCTNFVNAILIYDSHSQAHDTSCTFSWARSPSHLQHQFVLHSGEEILWYTFMFLSLLTYNRPLWVAVQGLIRPTLYTIFLLWKEELGLWDYFSLCMCVHMAMYLYNVACSFFARQRLRRKQLYNSRYWVTASQSGMFSRQQLETATEEWCFLCGPWRDVVSRTLNCESTERVKIIRRPES